MSLNKNDIRTMSRNGESDWEILHVVVRSGMEFPDAEYCVSSALNMDDEQRRQMVCAYDECC